ncbi:major facilitator superfamily domain-containing protein [Amylocarpus encephaloides]|uniref:Major facilitator superfamily domain-containing protein n=1 Tax=Amylocarpus encephaloides TaxID=45428 RepID=A0A9P7YKC0_9HELO|nr:major facilitator superfamily domain-containing protein [Amylocarpus encephaloides]
MNFHDTDEKKRENEVEDTFVENAKAGVDDGERNRDDAAMTRRILLKIDFRILPVLALLFLCSFLDRTNVGNAKPYGLEKDVKMTDHQYDTGLAVYYATYIASEIPSNLILRKVSPKIWLPALTVMWGIVTMCLGFVKSYAGFMVVRAILGITEGGLLPGIVLYLSGMYTRGEMALRLGLFYTAASLSGAFGGLLARGLTSIGQVGDQANWSWIFIIEGLLTVIIGAISYFLLPNSVDTASFLRPDERIFASSRLHGDLPASQLSADGTHEKFECSEVLRGIFSISTWLSATAYFGILAGLYSFGLFLPTIIVELGYTANEAQLWSVIPYAVASVVTVVISVLSDRLKLRGTIMLFVLIPAIIGYAVIANIGVEHPKVKYGMTFLMATGMYASVPCVLVWNSNNSAGHYKRATTTALQLAIANSGGFVATFIYPSRDKPGFHKGHTVVLGLLVFAWFMVALNVLYCAKVNRDKEQGKYVKYIGSGDDRDPGFKLVL